MQLKQSRNYVTMTFLVVLHTLNFRKFSYQVFISYSCIVFTLCYYLVKAVLSQKIIKYRHYSSHSPFRLEHLFSIAMEYAGMPAFLFR